MVRGISYVALANQLEDDIVSQGPGHRLPSEHELATQNGVSRITARAALQELEQRHVVRRSRGSGTYVALRIPYPIRAGMGPSWSQIVEAAGHLPSYEVLSVETVRAPADIARKLLINRGRSLVKIERRGRVDGDVALHQTIWIPSSLVSGLDRRLDELKGSLSTTMRERYGLSPERWRSRAELRAVSTEMADHLELVGRPPAWYIESANRCTLSSKPIELNRSWMRADCFQVRLELGPFDGSDPAGEREQR